MDLGLGSFLGNSIGAVGSLVSGALQTRAMQKYNEGQMNLMNAQNAYNERMQDKMNEYNSPQQQIQRNIAAGLNPLTGITSGNQSSAVQSAGAELKPLDYNGLQQAFNQLGNGVDQYINALSKQQQIEMLKQQNHWYGIQQRLDENLKVADKQLKDYEIRLQEFLNSDPDKTPEELKKHPVYQRLTAEIQTAKSNAENAKWQAKNAEQAYTFASSMNPKLLRKVDKEIKKIDNENEIGSVQAKLAKEYGLTPGDDGLYALIKMGVLHPDAYNKIISGLLGAIGNTVSTQFGKLKDFFF